MGSKLTYSSLPPEIKKIANDSMGMGVLKSVFSYQHTYHLMIKISDGIFIGFAVYHFQKTRVRGKTFLTGVIDCVCVDVPYRKNGFGTLLTFGVLRKMSAHGADRVEIVLKRPDSSDKDGHPGFPAIGNEDLLRCLGFRHISNFEGYYEVKSRRYGYDCVLCGDRPDSCTGVLYAIDEKSAKD